MTDVLTPASTALYRQLLPECFIIRFVVAFDEAKRRATTRTLFLTSGEFADLHRIDRLEPAPADCHLAVDRFAPEEQVQVVNELWKSASS